MSSKLLSPADFLGLTEARRVIHVELSDVGHKGHVFVREISTAEKEKVMGRPKGKTRVGKGMVELDWSQMPQAATAKFLRACMVTDETGSVQMYAAWLQELGKPHLVMERLEQLPNSVSDYIVKKCREISGMIEGDEGDEIEEKKES